MMAIRCCVRPVERGSMFDATMSLHAMYQTYTNAWTATHDPSIETKLLEGSKSSARIGKHVGGPGISQRRRQRTCSPLPKLHLWIKTRHALLASPQTPKKTSKGVSIVRYINTILCTTFLHLAMAVGCIPCRKFAAISAPAHIVHSSRSCSNACDAWNILSIEMSGNNTQLRVLASREVSQEETLLHLGLECILHSIPTLLECLHRGLAKTYGYVIRLHRQQETGPQNLLRLIF